MSGGVACKCEQSKKQPASARDWVVTQFQCNHSAFNGYKHTPSQYSAVSCNQCNASWRTKADYVNSLRWQT